MHKSATKCNKTIGKWCKNKHRASKIIDMLETYQWFVKGKRWEGVPSFIKEHQSANLSLKNLLHFCMEDSKNPIASH
jgi:hypothetical protein